MSNLAVLGLAAATWWDVAHGGWGPSGVAASVQATSIALGATTLLKAFAARNRPVLYTSAAPGAAGSLDNQRSFPSGHASVAFALATSYWLETGRRHRRDWKAWAALGAAGIVAGTRVAAAKHFPSDVVAGAALGVASAAVVYEIRF